MEQTVEEMTLTDALAPARVRRAYLQPLGDRIVVERLPEEADAMTESGRIVKPETAREKPRLGRIVATGEGYQLDNGMVRPLIVQEGDYIAFGRYAGVELEETLGKDVLVMREDEILGTLQFPKGD